MNDLRAKYSPVNPPLTSPTLLRQAVRAFVSNNDLKKSYGEHESIHALYSSWEEKCILNRSAASNKNWPDSESTKCRVSSYRNRGEYVTTRCEQISTISKVFLFLKFQSSNCFTCIWSLSFKSEHLSEKRVGEEGGDGDRRQNVRSSPGSGMRN